MRPHSVVLSVIGACLLWVGWFGFNAGSAVAAAIPGVERVCSHAFRHGGGGFELDDGRMDDGRQAQRSGRDFRSGGRAGGDHAGFGFRETDARDSDRPGGRSGVLPDGHMVKKMFGYDDALDAFGVHGMGGTLGALLTGVFATKEVNDLRMGKPMGLVDGYAGQIVNQVIAVAIAWGLAIVGTLIILKICDVVCGVRVTRNRKLRAWI